MKTVILAGGLGTRISEESHLRPKPMIEIGGMPMLWHVMKIYSAYGYNDFIVCAGYKQHMIKEYFADYYLHRSDVTFDFTNGESTLTFHRSSSDKWKVTIVDTGLNTMTGGRIKRIEPYVEGESFMLTYGDGVSDVDIASLVDCHKNNEATVTLTGVNLAQTKGVLNVRENGFIEAFREKDDSDCSIINGGFMVCDPGIFNYLDGDETVFEKESLNRLAAEGKLAAYHHRGFWKCMDTQREKEQLEEMWERNEAPWKTWC